MPARPYDGRVAALATMHGKERVIAPPFLTLTGLRVVATTNVDTDALGSFAGDIPRIGPMGEVAARKARLGMESLKTALGLASEGTFGPHPASPFVTAGMELLKFIDAERGIEISESLLTTRIVFASTTFRPGDDLRRFLELSCFPAHGLIARCKTRDGCIKIVKDIEGFNALDEAIDRLARISPDGSVLLSSDMRAHRNPTRMECIGELATRLATRVSVMCPACGCPGFGKRTVVEGLPCRECGLPTRSAKAERLACVACDYAETRASAHGKAAEDPMFCDICNP